MFRDVSGTITELEIDVKFAGHKDSLPYKRRYIG